MAMGEVQVMTWIEMLQQRKAEAVARRADPWRLPLERLRGKVGDDGVERISTQAVFDLLEIPQASRGAGACRRLAELMRELGWTPIKARGLNQAGFRDQIRGYAREQRRSPLS
jgi:hypothetical protein